MFRLTHGGVNAGLRLDNHSLFSRVYRRRSDATTALVGNLPADHGGPSMDAAQFDAFARTLAGRLSRRTALRGAGLGAGLLAAAGIQPNRTALARQMTSTPYVVVRQYQPSASIADLQQALGQGYAPQLAQQPGFIDYTVFDNGSGVTSITVFDSRNDEEAATNQLASWVEQNLASLLPSPTETTSGTAFVQVANTALICNGSGDQTPTVAVPTATPAPTTAPTQAAPTATALPVCTDPSRPGVGCTCTTGTQNPCGDTTLVCCAEAGAAPGAPGVCTPSSVGCDAADPTPAPTPCTDVGCPCTSGVEGTCADGLVCCQSQMGGDNVPGGPGMCATPDGCGDGNGAEGTPIG
jgi:hypothetical protein